VQAPSGEWLRDKGRHGVLCRLKAVWSMPERFRVVRTMQGAIQVLWFTFITDLCSWVAYSCICITRTIVVCFVLQAICTEAGLLALRERRMKVTNEDFKKAKENVLYRKNEGTPDGLYLWPVYMSLGLIVSYLDVYLSKMILQFLDSVEIYRVIYDWLAKMISWWVITGTELIGYAEHSLQNCWVFTLFWIV